ncbi:MAG: pentapeptide repeat-containing protein [Chloroflexi bacterium]|nr:pentapeptide repeat-containing protein [Chloroflexota bacterium]
MLGSMSRRLVRKPLFLGIAGVLIGIPIAGGAAMLVSEDFRDQVGAQVASALPGTVVGDCEIKPGTQCSNVNLSGANLFNARLSGANLSGANLTNVNLRRADLTRANLSKADLSRADLYRADLSWADLTGATLRAASLRAAQLNGANLTGATLPGGDFLRDADFCNTTMPDGSVDNSGCQ